MNADERWEEHEPKSSGFYRLIYENSFGWMKRFAAHRICARQTKGTFNMYILIRNRYLVWIEVGNETTMLRVCSFMACTMRQNQFKTLATIDWMYTFTDPSNNTIARNERIEVDGIWFWRARANGTVLAYHRPRLNGHLDIEVIGLNMAVAGDRWLVMYRYTNAHVHNQPYTNRIQWIEQWNEQVGRLQDLQFFTSYY